jgi:HAD superfamily hydrolase (TIGR01484 family)
MQPLAEFPSAALSGIRYVLTDIDDTLTHRSRLAGQTYLAVERLHQAGFKVIPVTAASAGWCDLIAHMWPVDAIIGENGGLCFHREGDHGATIRRYWSGETERQRHERQLATLAEEIRRSIPGITVSPDQHYRETTLAITASSGKVPEAATANAIVRLLGAAGARTTINSMWVLGWLGDFDKLAMTCRMIAEVFSIDIEAERQAFIYVGDSLNDEPMFSFFPNSVGVSTVTQVIDRMATPPRWITRGPGGAGFNEIAAALLHN